VEAAQFQIQQAGQVHNLAQVELVMVLPVELEMQVQQQRAVEDQQQ
jgi:hypothetical protein